MKIAVTRCDIDEGVAKDPICCPLARAIGRALSAPVLVYYEGVYLLGHEEMLAKIPDPVVGWMGDFDVDGTGEPFEFELKFHNFS